MSEAADTLKSALRLITEMIDILENSDDAEAPQAFFEAYHEANGQLNYAVYQALHPLLRAQRGQGSPSATAKRPDLDGLEVNPTVAKVVGFTK